MEYSKYNIAFENKYWEMRGLMGKKKKKGNNSEYLNEFDYMYYEVLETAEQ